MARQPKAPKEKPALPAPTPFDREAVHRRVYLLVQDGVVRGLAPRRAADEALAAIIAGGWATDVLQLLGSSPLFECWRREVLDQRKAISRGVSRERGPAAAAEGAQPQVRVPGLAPEVPAQALHVADGMFPTGNGRDWRPLIRLTGGMCGWIESYQARVIKGAAPSMGFFRHLRQTVGPDQEVGEVYTREQLAELWARYHRRK